jgi:uracil-DNA glycosylase family 4
MDLSIIAREIHCCILCDLHRSRTWAVPGEGPGYSRIMLVGEAPGREEDIQGKPFVGRSGGILNEILKEVGIRRDDTFITSVVKCRPPENRVPRKREVETCIEAHLQRQIEVIDPAIICLLGGVATKALLRIDCLSEGRRRVFRRGRRVFFPTYHPAAAGRSRSWHRALCEDMKELSRLVPSP